jgi:hypothetical protein
MVLIPRGTDKTIARIAKVLGPTNGAPHDNRADTVNARPTVCSVLSVWFLYNSDVLLFGMFLVLKSTIFREQHSQLWKLLKCFLHKMHEMNCN